MYFNNYNIRKTLVLLHGCDLFWEASRNICNNQKGTVFQIILIQSLKNAGASYFVVVLGAHCSFGTPYSRSEYTYPPYSAAFGSRKIFTQTRASIHNLKVLRFLLRSFSV